MSLPHRDRLIAFLLLALSLFNYAYFIQGDGWSAESSWLTTRAIVERHTFEITPFRSRTNDVSIYHDRVYSNKPPGLPLAGVPPYWLLHHLEREPTGEATERMNMRAITVVSCALPGAILSALIFVALRRDGTSPTLAAAMTIAFAFGSIVWPYTGMLFNHVLVTVCFFGAWLLLRRSQFSILPTALASLMLGGAMLCEYMIAPIAAALIVFDWIENRDRRRIATLCIGPLFAIAAMMLFQHAVFGSAFAPSYMYERRPISPSAVLSGRFQFPDIRRLYWITFHRFRGLFYCCPVFIVALLSLSPFKPIRATRETKFVLLVIAYHVLLLLTYTFWAGGHGVGPRFAMPALPFLLLMSRRGFERFPFIAWPLALCSIFIMLAVTAVEALYPGNEAGSPLDWDPVGGCIRELFANHVAILPQSDNFGLQVGLHGAASVLPAAATILSALLICLAMFLKSRRHISSPPQ